ncbi:acyltransferase family protein [Leifsonia shinshuensis]|uniref:Acyltransferase n=1 Tax=Leifsonia shinshuensis TaxID=150026 RepID=A0A7G6YF40_9MICO|nr:acyltransferase [Leifsonia shinshuensis]QNE37105.1 acyltransferase [Leifsonia shinshuensis]
MTLRVPAGRDLSVDFARAMCLPVVVLLHALQLGIGGDPLGAFNALAGFRPLAWATWPLMIMPVFFFCGGFAALGQWRRMRRDGATSSAYLRSRTRRLAQPVVLVMPAVGAVLAIMALSGADGTFLEQLAHRLAEPLWFIAVYIGVSACVPAMAALHERAPLRTLTALAAGAAMVDLLSRAGGLPVAALNWGFVWLFAQQLGFLLRDGWFERASRWLLVGLAAASYAAMGLLVAFAGYSYDMLTNLNPPTLCILLLSLGQVSLFALLQPAIRRAMAVRPVLAVVFVFGLFGMVIYLWHTVAMAAVVGIQLALGLPFPPVLSPSWWATRPVWILAIAAFVALACLVVPRLEKRWPRAARRPLPLVLAAFWSAVAMVGVGVVLLGGYLPAANGLVGWVLVTVAVLALLIGGIRAPRRAPAGESDAERVEA